MRRVISLISVTVCLVVALSFGGCASMIKGAVNKAVDSAASKAGVSVDEKDSSITVSTDSGTATITTSSSWPKDWPSSIPKLSGTLTDTLDTSSSGSLYIVLTFTGNDIAAMQNYASNLESQGYTKELESTDAGSYTADVQNDQYNLIISYNSDDKSSGLVLSSVSDSSST